MSLSLTAEPDYDPDPHLRGHRSVYGSSALSRIIPLRDVTGHVYGGEKTRWDDGRWIIPVLS